MRRLFILVLALCIAAPVAAKENGVWREAFQSSPADYEVNIPKDFVPPKEMKITPEMIAAFAPKPPQTGTLRWRLMVSAGGTKIRVRLSNEESAVPLVVASATVGLAGEGYDAKAGSISQMTFGGNPSITIAPGAPALSDPINLPVAALDELIVSIHTPSGIALKFFGGAAMQLAEGDQTGAVSLNGAQLGTGRPFVTGVSVLSGKAPRVIVAFGDSITDGNHGKATDARSWPERLARRLNARKAGRAYAVVNAGIGGNRVLTSGWGKSALARFDRDALRIDGVSHIVLLEGINDIGNSGKGLFGDNPVISAADIIAGYRQLVARAHQRGIKLIIATILPFEGAMYYSAEKEMTRAEVNAWIRSSGEADGVIDFDAVTRDLASPGKMAAAFDSGDHLHPGPGGYKLMGDAIDLGLFD